MTVTTPETIAGHISAPVPLSFLHGRLRRFSGCFAGYRGERGQRGQPGYKGASGDPGDKGGRGKTGDKGDPGFPGVQGPKGPPGISASLNSWKTCAWKRVYPLQEYGLLKVYLFIHFFFLYPFTTSVADPGEGPMGPAPLTPPPPPIFLDQTEAQRAEKKFSGDRVPHLSRGLDDRPLLALLSQGLDPALLTLTG